ncbi:hypothetical protein NUW58_g759 [Xylaria curta]|uniref:Uncharacterized protein n=1 Tax=Xylaria curta TaxID=42375 RepID=A0ACC1PP05_9PEZI|nr:hypothetical protein NUW58_g759 [Xylaria curta]
MASRRRSKLPSPRPSSAPSDVDSAQIVSMALDLSESRRLASRRNLSSPIPPRLSQFPNSTAGGNLKQHLQQQRRSSRNISPRAGTHLSPRVVSTPRISSPLQSTFEHDSSYTYHFSPSTRSRAEKAKEYLELMAQYRRLLLLLPPLKQESRSRPSTSTAISSSASTGSPLDPSGSQTRILGREYNPLQYIRNRKIRTRERQTVDGEAQGFGEVLKVTNWIDKVMTTSPMSELPKLPPFTSADEFFRQQLPASNLPRPVSASTKPKRPRFEWSIDPADLLADIYWLEQDDNRFLIEDRHYAKIFTHKVAASQPTTQATGQSGPALTTPLLKEKPDDDDHEMLEHDVPQPMKPDVETIVPSTRNRARQKLQDLRTMHHKHSNSIYSHHDFLRFRRGDSSDSSENESDRRRRGRTNTISASGQDLLEKQMNEMLAKESEDEQKAAIEGPDIRYLKPLPAPMITPEQASQAPRPGHSRRPSRMDAVEDRAPPDKSNLASPIHSGRASLEVPDHLYRSSLDLELSKSALTEVASKGHQNGYVPAIGMDLSPITSRPSSPTRSPFSKVKSIFRDRSRDRSRERSRDREDRDTDERLTSPIEPTGTMSISAVTEDVPKPLERPASKIFTPEFVTKPTHETHKSHKSLGSFSLRPDEQVGLRTIFKGGAKLDDMIRGGVSKVTDLIWKKDYDSSDSTDDDSDVEIRRGRSPESTFLSPDRSARYYEGHRPAKNYIDIMPNFTPTTDFGGKSVSQEVEGSSVQVLPQPPSRSPRFDQLKPPRIDIRGASAGLPELEGGNPRQLIDSDTSELDSNSRDSSYPTVRPRQSSKELQNMLSIHDTDSPASRTKDGMRASEHRSWVIPNRASLSQHALISRREVARLRALILCSGVKAMEISRRANEPRPLSSPDCKATGLLQVEMKQFLQKGEPDLRVSQTELFPTTGRVFSRSIDHSIQVFEKSVSEFSIKTAPRLYQQADAVHHRVAIDLMDMTRRAADEADDVSHDILDNQRQKVKSVVDTIDKMLRQRRRRFRWLRRAGWLALEWLLVGFMWYVWFVVMIARIVLGVGRGAVSFVRWLFCL